MKTKVLFLVVLLGLTPALSTATYGKVALLGGLLTKAIEKKSNRIAIENKSNNRTADYSGNSNNNSSSNDEVTLIVTGKAATTERATTIALRSAIEQAYGTFVSANTTILNDDLVKDEIVTISSGNIKSYSVLNEVKCEDGQMMVTLDATVCISKLVNYAKSKGASTEFAGATFAQNMKMKELNKKNELQALQNVLSMTKELLPLAFNKKLSIAEPTMAEEGFIFDNPRLWLDKKEITWSSHPSESDKVIECCKNHLYLANGYYRMVFDVNIEANDNTKKALGVICNTIKAIALNQDEVAEYEKTKIKTSRISIKWPFRYDYGRTIFFKFRNSQEEINKIFLDFTNLFLADFSNFEIIDNLGNTSSFNGYLMGMYRCDFSSNKEDELFRKDGTIWFDGSLGQGLRNYFSMQGTGLFKGGVFIAPCVPYFWNTTGCVDFSGNKFGSWKIEFKIPAEEISKYSNFELAAKNK